MSDLDREALLDEIKNLLPDPIRDDTQLDGSVILIGGDPGEVVVRIDRAHNTGTKRILPPMASVGDIPTIPGELFAKFQSSFYSDPPGQSHVQTLEIEA